MIRTFYYQHHSVPETPVCTKQTSRLQVCLKKFAVRSAHSVLLLIISLLSHSVDAQSYDGLNELKGNKTETYFSSGAAIKAARMAKQLDRVMLFYNQHLGFTPSVTLLVLSHDDWSKHTKFPFYGMPHYTSNKTLVVAAEDNDYWKSMIPPLDKMPKEYTQVFTQTYTNQIGQLTMEPFFDLLAIHELGHAYHIQGGLVMQRKWMGELFCNILLHSYIAEMEPGLLKALTIFPEMVVATTGKSSLRYTTLEDLETYYNEIGPKHPQNYGWYQCRWHIAAGKIYDSSKMEGIKNLWSTLINQREILNDTELAELLSLKVHKSVADVQLKWNEVQ